MKRQIILCLIFIATTMAKIANAQHPNVMIGNIGNPNEPSIVINPKNTNQILAAANINKYYFSNNSGFTWQTATLTSTYGVWGDPVVVCDTNQQFYFFHLSNPPQGSWIDRIVCQRWNTFANTNTWTNGSFMGKNGTKAQDKQWVAIDRQNNTLYCTWTQFDQYGSTASNDSSNILLSKSTDSGNTWSQAKRINQLAGNCIDSDNTTEGAVPTIGTNGQIYVAWAINNTIKFDKSTDGGQTWLANDLTIANMPGGWDYPIAGLQRANGLPVTVCDLSNNPATRGTIYVNWTDQRNGNTDVFLIKSTNGGQNWSPQPIKINNDNTNKDQFLSWLTIDQTNGNLYCVFYDRRNYNDNRTDVYLATSTDGGNTFTNTKISETPFLPSSSVFFGDYTNISAHNNVVRPIWTRMDNGVNSVWTALINTNILQTQKEQLDLSPLELDLSPNPFKDNAFITFKIRKMERVNLIIYDILGNKIQTIIENQNLQAGKYIKEVGFMKPNLPSGFYYCKLTIGDKSITKKIIYNNQ